MSHERYIHNNNDSDFYDNLKPLESVVQWVSKCTGRKYTLEKRLTEWNLGFSAVVGTRDPDLVLFEIKKTYRIKEDINDKGEIVLVPDAPEEFYHQFEVPLDYISL